MAGISELIDGFKKLLESSDTIEEAKENYTKLSGVFDLTAVSAENLAEKVKEVKENLSSKLSTTDLKALVPTLVEVENRLDAVGYSGTALGLAVASIAPGILDVFKPFDSLTHVSKNAADLTAQMSTLADNLEKAGALKGPLKWAAGVAQASDASRNMENQLIKSMSAAGQMTEFMDSLGGDVGQLNTKVLQFSALTADIGSGMGVTAERTADLAKGFMELPGIFDQVVQSGEDGEKQFHMLDAAMRVARGTGQDFNDVQEDIVRMTQEYGATAQSSVETISRMYNATDILGLNMKDMRTYIKDAGDQFKFFGDNSSSALDIMGRFGPALKESGLGPSAITEIVGGFTRGVSQMGVAQRAFLASQTGTGGGGLRGGLEIEEMLAKGNVGDVASMIEESLKNLGGGRILSREEAIEGGPGAASQFEFQRQLLQQGPYGKLAGSPEEAAKLLEALSKGDRGGLAGKIGGGAEALEGSMDRGEKIATRQNNVLIKANNELAKIRAFQSTVAADGTRAVVGIEDGLLVSREMASNLQSMAQGASKSKLITGADTDQGVVGGITGPEFATNLKTTLQDTKLGSMLADSLRKTGILEKLGVPTGGAKPPKPGEATKPTEPTKATEPRTPPRPGPTGALTVPPRPGDIVAPDVRRQATAAAREPAQTLQQQQQQGQPTPASQELVIKVMGEKDVLRVIKASLNEYGQFIIDDEYYRSMTGSGGP